MLMTKGVRRKAWASLAIIFALVLAGCRGFATTPADITTTSAELRAQAECQAETEDNPCTGWFLYWADGETTVHTTEPVTANVDTGGLTDFAQEVTGLTPDTLYHVQFCGYGDSNVGQPGLCIGPESASSPSATDAGEQPDPANYSATQNFRTASADTTATVDLGRVLSTADTDENPISRDGGLSVAYSDTEALWIFGDTGQRNGPGFLALGTAATGTFNPGDAPQALDELPRPPAAPQPGLEHPANFFPAVDGLVTPDDPPVPCGSPDSRSYSAAWLSGGARIPGTSRVMLIWGEFCVAQGDDDEGEPRGWPVERWRITEYDPATNEFVRSFAPFVADPMHQGLPATMRPSNPVFGDDGFVYLFGSQRDPDQVYVARVSADPAAWDDPASYRWWGSPDGGPARWTTDHTSVVSVLPPGVEPFSIHVADYASAGGGSGLAMMVKTSFYDSPHFQILTADSPLGPWTAGPAGRVPDNCHGGGLGCYAFYGHPELSSADTFVFSWLSPGDRGSDGGHIRVGAIDW